ncbi:MULTISPECIES: hypothetical protein [unclassified Paenibacillus]|uniref:hypothetical protein n=1 Tax=unclassified Paenibacillus TaxID=185978 RepID=UPI0036D28332
MRRNLCMVRAGFPPTAVSVNRTETSESSASASSMQARTVVPRDKVEVQPPDDGAIQAKMGIVPPLLLLQKMERKA